MARRHFIDNAPTATFGPVGTTDVTWTINSATGFPTSFPFNVTLGLGTAAQENVSVTNVVGTTVTAVRNVDGLGAFSHPSGETFTHTALAIDYDEANAHVNASTGVHGVTGAVVGTTDTQTLSNKTFAGLSLTANSGVVGVTVTGDNTGDLADFKNGSTTVAKFDKDGKLTAAQVTTGGTLSVTGAATLSSTAAITGNTTVGGTLGVTGTSTLAAVNSGNTAVTGTLSTSGTATLAATSITGNEAVGGTFSVAGASTVHAVSATTVSTSGAATLASASVTGALVVGGLLTLVSAPTIQKFTSSGTWTKPTGLVAVRVRGVGGGGGGGGLAANAGQGASGGGAAGGYFEAYIAAGSLGSTEAVTVGAGGAGAVAGNNSGSTGLTTSFGAHCSATGGAGGAAMICTATQAQALGGVGGTATGGDVNVQGSDGTLGMVTGGAAYFLNYGAASVLGSAASSGVSTGRLYGSGCPGTTSASANVAGGAGGAGVVIVECFFS